MKWLISICAAFFWVASVVAQSPEKMSYQAVIRDANNHLVVNSAVGMKTSILKGSASGVVVYEEIFNPNPLTNANGLISVEIGGGIPLFGTFGAIDWSAGPYFIKTETDPAGGTNYTITATSQLLSVPYALHAKDAESIVGGESDPVWKDSPSYGITMNHIANWEASFAHSNQNTGPVHGSTIAGSNILRLTNPSAVRFLRINADNTVSALDASDFRSAIGAGTGEGTITNITTENGITGGPITSIGTIGLTGQALALHNLNENGFVARTEQGMLAARSISASGNGIIISNGAGVTGNPTITLDIGNNASQVAAGNHGHGNISDDGKIGVASGRLITTNHGTLEALAGTAEGEMLYWNGTVWVRLSPGINGQSLIFKDGKPTWWPEATGSNVVVNPTTGRVWMDRNLGASHVASSSTDAGSYGYLYQWGRDGDGHQIRTSGTTSTKSSSNTPGHDDFITAMISPYDWRNPQNDFLWQGGGVNNPCPTGYHVPTETEWEVERLSWWSNNPDGALGSVLKLPMAGYRAANTGSLSNVGTSGTYWTSTVNGNYSSYLYFDNAAPSSSNAGINTSGYRASGRSVRCIKG
jgi:hypothetical protein